jgi:mannosyltransferase OCH1-like enzyme
MEQATNEMPQRGSFVQSDENVKIFKNNNIVYDNSVVATNEEFESDEVFEKQENRSTTFVGTNFWVFGLSVVAVALTCLVTVAVNIQMINDNSSDILEFKLDNDSSLFHKQSRRLLQEQHSNTIDNTANIRRLRIAVFATSGEMFSSTEDDMYASNLAVSRKQHNDLTRGLSKLSSSKIQFDSINYLLSEKEQIAFVKDTCGEEAYQRVQELSSSSSTSADASTNAKRNVAQWLSIITQWCAIASATDIDHSDVDAVMVLDPTTPIVLNPSQFPNSLLQYLNEHVVTTDTTDEGKAIIPNVAVLGFENFPNTIHSSFLILNKSKENNSLARKMLKLAWNKGDTFNALDLNSLLFSQTLHELIFNGPNVEKNWHFLQQSCRTPPQRRFENEVSAVVQNNMVCPKESGYCCTIQDRQNGSNAFTVLMSRHLVLPYQVLNHDQVSSPYQRKSAKANKKGKISRSVVSDDELPFISTVTETLMSKPDNSQSSTPTFYEMLEAKKCLPESDTCTRCLREKAGATCHSCGSYCHCYCKALCNPDTRPHSRFVAKKIFVSPPPFRRDPSRIIPRIVHQTWFEELSSTKYPNMSRMVQSFARSGWEYKFYTDDEAASFLETHFPPEILEAYKTLRPGAFKADLFRYCVLLIHGGVYADVDIQLESALDLAIAPDVGFMVPIDEVSMSGYIFLHRCSKLFSYIFP